MSVTPNFSWPLIENTDFVTNLPADLEALADDIDADVWAIKGTADAALPETIIDAAGDLIYGSAADTAARLAIGTAGQVLQVNSGATAPEWVTPAGGGADPLFMPKNKALWARSGYARASLIDNFNPDYQFTFYTPIYLPDCTLDRIAIKSGASVTTANVRLGIFNNDTNNLPSTVLLDAGTVSVTGTNTEYSITISQAITSGWYWLALKKESNVTNQLVSAKADTSTNLPNWGQAIQAIMAINNGVEFMGISEFDGTNTAFATAGTRGTLTNRFGSMPFINVRTT